MNENSRQRRFAGVAKPGQRCWTEAPEDSIFSRSGQSHRSSWVRKMLGFPEHSKIPPPALLIFLDTISNFILNENEEIVYILIIKYRIFMSHLNLYDKEAAINHIKALEFKRLAGTEGEIKTLNYIQKELKRKNIEVKIQSFNWAPSMVILMKLAFLFIMIYILLYEIILLFQDIIWIILFLDVLLIILIIFGMRILFDFTRIVYIGKRKESKNITVKIPAFELYPKRPVIFLTAHYDSVSTRYSTKQTIILYAIGGILMLIYLFLTFLLGVWSFFAIWSIIPINPLFLLLNNISFIIGIIIITDIFIILFNKRENRSTGSIDNASGIAILLELAKLLKESPLEKTDVIIIWCGAEEWGLWGSKMYLKEHFEELDHNYDLDKSYNINIDMVGSYIGLLDKTGIIKKKPVNEYLNDVLHAAAQQQNISIIKSYIPFGAGSDHMSFKSFAKNWKKKFQVACFTSSKDAKYIHSSNDTPDKCSADKLNGCIEVCFNTMKSLDLRVENLKEIG